MEHALTAIPPLRVAALLSCDSFERFFGAQFGLTRARFAAVYRNDWVWEYSSQLDREGIDMVVFIASFGPSEEVRTVEGRTITWVHMTRLVRLYERFPLLARGPVARWLAQVLYTAAMLPALREALRHQQIDVLYIQEYWTGRFDLLALTMGRILPVVAADHGGRSFHQLTLAKRRAFGRAAVVTCQTAEEAVEAARFAAPVRIVGNAVDTDWFAPADGPRPPRAGPRLLHVARLVDSHKRTSLVLRAMSHLPGATLDVVGSGPDEAALLALTAELGLEARVRFHGFVSDRTRIRELYREADALVQPSSNEARLLAALEAMACGTPAVLTDIPAFREILVGGRGGRLVEPDPESVAAGVRAVIASSDGLREEARDVIVRQHSWSVRRQELGVLLKSVRAADR